jgi:hypothetical protein
MQKIFLGLLRLIKIGFDFCWIHKLKAMIILIVCFSVESINNPSGFINFWLLAFINLILGFLPSTPDDLKIHNLLSDFAASYPFIGWGLIVEVIQVPMGFLFMNITLKMIKFLRG